MRLKQVRPKQVTEEPNTSGVHEVAPPRWNRTASRASFLEYPLRIIATMSAVRWVAVHGARRFSTRMRRPHPGPTRVSALERAPHRGWLQKGGLVVIGSVRLMDAADYEGSISGWSLERRHALTVSPINHAMRAVR